MKTDQQTERTKITWQELKSACEQAGIKDDDELDTVFIAWGEIKALTCKKDADFGWQVILDCDC